MLNGIVPMFVFVADDADDPEGPEVRWFFSDFYVGVYAGEAEMSDYGYHGLSGYVRCHRQSVTWREL